jgi:2-amino-4-hydroxy-6-hydroxymethyldihydropteridine diphosphokinase
VIVIGLGGNLGGEAAIVERFRRAREALGPARSAPLYRSAPIGPAQPEYLNTAIAIGGDWLPAQLIAFVLEIELQLGRDRRVEARWGPRAIDLDVLAWDDRVIAIEGLTVPHPRIAERRFVLLPLRALGVAVPGIDLEAAERRVRDQAVTEISAGW